MQLGCHPVAVVNSHVTKEIELVTDKFSFKQGGPRDKHVVAT
jgi:hypothetical protein